MRFSAKGGTLIEFDDRESKFNFQNTLTRRTEGYYKEILNPTTHSDNSEIATIHDMQYTVSDEVKNNLVFDDYERVSFIDLIKDGDKILKNFSNEIFNINHICFSTDELIKDYNILDNGFGFQNSLVFAGTHSYILEINLHFAHYNDLKLNSEIVQNQNELRDNIFTVEDVYTKRKIIIEFEQEMKLNYKLIKTLSQSEKGLDTIIQGINLSFEIPFTDELELKGKFLCLK